MNLMTGKIIKNKIIKNYYKLLFEVNQYQFLRLNYNQNIYLHH